jgi:predicted tellurium resistance membrane protein TerC
LQERCDASSEARFLHGVAANRTHLMDLLTDPHAWIAFATLTLLELVLGIDNVIFISILAGRLPQHQQKKARNIGLALAMLMRAGLLLSLAWMVRLVTPLFTVMGNEISGRDLILILGGVFLLWKSTREIHRKVEAGSDETTVGRAAVSFAGVIVQIVLLDAVFSLDSVITAVGMVDRVEIMIAAVVVAIVITMIFAGRVSDFVGHHPTIKILALGFLLLIGVTLIADGFGQHISKGFIYFAMGFSVFIEMLNLRMRRTQELQRKKSREAAKLKASLRPQKA